MSTAVFDTHAYVKRLKSVGFTEEQAEAQAEVLSGIIENNLATNMISRKDLKEFEYRLAIRLGSAMVIAVGLVATLVKLL